MYKQYNYARYLSKGDMLEMYVIGRCAVAIYVTAVVYIEIFYLPYSWQRWRQ